MHFCIRQYFLYGKDEVSLKTIFNKHQLEKNSNLDLVLLTMKLKFSFKF